MNTKTQETRIYVACLAAYNNGYLHGAWIDADQDLEAIQEGVQAMLVASPIAGAEEYAIHDYEGFEGVSISEYQVLESVAEIAGFLGERGVVGGKLIEYFGDLDEAREAIEDRYAGVYASVAEFVQEISEETNDIPDHLQAYIDYECMGRDMEISDILTFETGYQEVHIFWSH